MIVFPLKVLGSQTPNEAGLQARVVLTLQTKTREFVATEFILDTGASISQMGLQQAEELGLRLPAESRNVRMTTAGGMQTRQGKYGIIVVRFDQYPDRLFAWDCWFLDHWPADVSPLLGLGGRVLRDLRITFAGANAIYPNGSVTLEIVS